jgi:hypothetical protein
MENSLKHPFERPKKYGKIKMYLGEISCEDRRLINWHSTMSNDKL